MADSPLARLHAWSTDHACAVIAIADEDSFEDPAAAALLRFALGDVDDLGSKPELVLVATPERLQLHCSASALSGVRALLGATAAPLPVDVFSPSPQLGPESDAAVDFKLEATRRMLQGAREAAPGLLAGLSPVDEAAARWPLLRAATLGEPVPQPTGAAPPDKAAAALHVLLRSVGPNALQCEGGLDWRARLVASGFSRLMRVLDGMDPYEVREVSEKGLEAALRGDEPLFAAPAAGAPPPDAAEAHCGVWVGARTQRSVDEPGGKKLPVRISGPNHRQGRHLIARLSDGSGLAATRTFFLSNGRVCHHWQHRVFPDGEVLEPVVEDEVPEVEGAEGAPTAPLPSPNPGRAAHTRAKVGC